jgi:phosphate transport system permease protein
MLANQFGEADGSQVSSLMYAAFVLMLLTLVVNVLAQWIVRRLSLRYT